MVQARIDAIESHRAIAIVERPEYKRRWVSEPWERREKQALRTWLLDHCEDERLWFEHRKGARHPRPRTIDQLARDLGVDAAVRSAAVLYASRHLGRRDATLRDVLAAILAEEHVPYVGALRYKESGLRKRAQWEQVWQLQRSEDRTGEAMGIPVPPRFSAADFRHASYWSLRGSLDIPRERFVSYPGAVAEGDSPLIGWSGWSDTDRVLVLLDLVGVLRQQPQPRADRIAPLLRRHPGADPLGPPMGGADRAGPELRSRRDIPTRVRRPAHRFWAQYPRLDLLAAAESDFKGELTCDFQSLSINEPAGHVIVTTGRRADCPECGGGGPGDRATTRGRPDPG